MNKEKTTKNNIDNCTIITYIFDEIFGILKLEFQI